MTKIALLHIGTRKTGTTSIQAALTNARPHLGTIRYPLISQDRDQNRLIAHYVAPEQMPVAWQSLSPSSNRLFRRIFVRELASASGAILSAEALSSWFSRAEAQALRNDLEQMGFDQFHVILYVRDPADYFLSYTQQVLKSSSSVAPYGEHPAAFRYGLQRIAETWETVFPGCLVVRKYSEGENKDITKDFNELLQKYLGVSIPAMPRRENTSISAEGMKILQDYRVKFSKANPEVLTTDAYQLVKFLIASTTMIRQTKPHLKPEIAEVIRANHRAEADFIYSKYGVDLGLSNASANPTGLNKIYRVNDLVESLDLEIVQDLLHILAKSGLDLSSLKRPLIHRIASRAYRAITS
jgi:hypothetical protein